MNTAFNALKERLNFNSFNIKLFAMLIMAVDHIGYFFYFPGVPIWFRYIGRIAAPIFLYIAAEGFHYTHNRKKYLTRLYMACLAMGAGNALLDTMIPHPLKEMAGYNIFASIFLCVLTMQAVEYIRGVIKTHSVRGIIIGALIIFAPFAVGGLISMLPYASYPVWLRHALITLFPNPIYCEGGMFVYIIGVSFYLFRGTFFKYTGLLAYALIFFLSNNYQWLMVFSIPVLALYNGKPGLRSPFARRLFYIFYPAHIWLFYIISALCIR